MRSILTIVVALVSLHVFAQKITVLDKETGKPIRNVNVFTESGKLNVYTDASGMVEINGVSDDEWVYFSHISYALWQLRKSKIGRVVYLKKGSEQLDEVVLSVFKSQAKRKRVAEQVAVLTQVDIQQLSPQTSADLLANVPGVKVQKSQFGGGSPVLRGMESNRVLLVVDGVRMNNAIYRKGHLQNSITIAPNQLDRTEVVFGPTSVVYGSDALGGVIHYVTKTPGIAQKTKVNAQFFNRFSSVNNEITTHASVELQTPKWGSFTSVTYSDFGDLLMGKNRRHGFEDWGKVFLYSENRPDFYAPNPTANDNPNLQRNTGYNQTDVMQKFFVPLSSKTDFKLNIQYSESSDIPRFDRLDEHRNGTLRFAEWRYGPQKRLLVSPQLFLNPEKGIIDNGTITLAYQNVQESRITRRFGSLDRTTNEEDVDIFSVNGDFTVSLTDNGRRNLSYGFEFSHNEVNSSSLGESLNVSGNQIVGVGTNFPVQSRYPDGIGKYTSSALYVGYRQDISNKSTLNTGVRFTHTSLTAQWDDNTFIQLPEPHVHFNNAAFTATVGFVHRPNDNWQLNGVLSSGFRSPNIDDIGRIREKAGNVQVPNTRLRPEFAYNAEIGFQKYFNNRKFSLGLNTYYTLLDQYITRADFLLNGNTTINFHGEIANIIANQNRGTAYVFGYTGNYQGKLSERFTTAGFITYTKGRTYDTDEPLSSIPPLFGQFDLNYVGDKLSLGAVLRFNSKKDISDFNLTEHIDNHDLTPVVNPNASNDNEKYFGSPKWMTLGFQTSYTFSPTWKLQGMIQNIFDEHYREFASGISAPGRNFSVALIANL